MQQHAMTMAILAAALLLVTPSSATLISAEQAIGERSEPHTIQLRGRNSKSSSSSTRSLSAITAGRNRFEEDRRPLLSSNRFDANRRPTRDTVFLPVSPGIAEDVDPENLPCLVETICEQPELSILCGFITANLVEWSKNKNENFFLGEGEGIFFAPLNLAFQDSGFSLMTNILSTDLADAAILENVLSYHAVPIDINATSSNNATTDDLLFVVEDFECGEEVMMANGQTTRIICFQSDKVLVGNGNRNMRTLPRIIEEGIEACDGTVVLHYVNQLILPGLPLVAMATQAPEVPRGETVICPIDSPEPNGSCQDPGEPCSYGYTYTGCFWDDLQCIPTTTCYCFETTWMCTASLLAPCPEEDPELVVVIASTSAAEEEAPLILTKTAVPVTPLALPTGKCDPNLPLPRQPSTPEPECPVDQPRFDDSCSGYPEGETCNYNFMYTGCTWDTLQCSWIASCSCDERSETWACRMKSLARCGVFDAEVGEWVDNTPEGLPWGDTCNPHEELPTPPEPQCPEGMPDFLDNSCEGYSDGKMCNYNHMYIGCTWDTLRCFSTASCSCNDESETWACTMARIAGCDASAPKELPWGDSCDPDGELPSPPPTTIREEGSIEGRLSDECPPSADFGSCSGYEPDLPCDYNYSYTGCTWETLECRPSTQCQCDKFGNGNWACRLDSRQGCFDRPEGHPGGLLCDPNDPLPIPLLPITPVVATSQNEERDQKAAVAEMMAGGAMP